MKTEVDSDQAQIYRLRVQVDRLRAQVRSLVVLVADDERARAGQARLLSDDDRKSIITELVSQTSQENGVWR